MVCEIPPLAEPVKYPGGVKAKPPFEMGVANFDRISASTFFPEFYSRNFGSVVLFVSPLAV